MPKRTLIVYSHKYLLKISIMTLTGLLGQAAMAACPVANTFNIESKVVGTTAQGETVYFCKQEFDESALIFKPSATDLVPGGSQVISRGNTIQNSPLVSSIDLSGFDISNLAFNTLSANFPNKNGIGYASMGLFNFYTKRNILNDCSLQYPEIKSFLQSNPNIFSLNPQSGAATGDTSSATSIVKITGARLKSELDPSKELAADIFLYHTNAGKSGQYFTNGTDRYCWVGVATRVVINPNSGSLKYAGDYKLDIAVALR